MNGENGYLHKWKCKIDDCKYFHVSKINGTNYICIDSPNMALCSIGGKIC